ncbi:helix-turn-helix transcriptional regulator [Streptomyces sp. NPDC093595]|uniref:helix-turn-helix transcriptional regulator n=1 Tax=Streptomyces sp. NPDC093595 TaxID=3366045 RepID=UPI0037F56055
MSSRMRAQQKPPPGIVYANDWHSKDGSEVILGIASRCGVTHNTYRKWRMANKGPRTFMLGKRVAAYVEDVDAWIHEQAQAAIQQHDHAMRPAEPRIPRKAALASAA